MNANTVLNVDRHTHAAVARKRTAKAQRAIRVVSQIGSSAVVLPVSALVAIALARSGKRDDAVRIAAAAAAGALVGSLLQQCFRRDRPAEGRAKTGSSSFPSTHTLTATAAYGAIALTALRSDDPRARAGGALLLGSALPLVPLTRVLLGMHWTSDVVASAALGGAIAGGATQVRSRRSCETAERENDRRNRAPRRAQPRRKRVDV